jgi:cytochrome c peroxidase
MKSAGILFFLIPICFILFSCMDTKVKEEKLPDEMEQTILKMAQSYFSPLSDPDLKNMSPERKKMTGLGKKLFYDKILSGEQKINCASCHDIKNYGAGKLPVSKGNKDQLGFRNPPSIINAYLQYSQNWDAKYKNVEDQFIAMILSKTEMGMTDTLELLNRLSKDPLYVKAFSEAFPGSNPSITLQTLKQAVGSFLRTLTSPSRFDVFLKGDTDALTSKEKTGLKSFMENGCVPCHSSPLVGGSMAQKFAVFGYYWDFTNSKTRDKGRYELTKNPADEYIFKVPQLRNVDKTSPYFHDGSVSSLEEAIRVMGMTEANRQLNDTDVENIATFLRSLTGKIPEHALEN